MKRMIAAAMVALVLVPSATTAGSLPVGFEAKCGFGIGYYSMGEFNDYLQFLREELELNFEDMNGDFNAMIEGRVWFIGRIAGSIGYEHYWSDHIVPTGSSSSASYKAPADVLTLGGTVHIFRVPTVIDINAGVKGSFAKVIFGTDESGRFVEYKSNDYGWDIYGEVNTNFMNPVEVGFMLGYRNLKVDGFVDKFGDAAEFVGTGAPVVVDYSGIYFYFTAGVAIW